MISPCFRLSIHDPFFCPLLLQSSCPDTTAKDTDKHLLKASHQESTANARSTTTKNNDYNSKKSKTNQNK